jgi:hypothetical protein
MLNMQTQYLSLRELAGMPAQRSSLAPVPHNKQVHNLSSKLVKPSRAPATVTASFRTYSGCKLAGRPYIHCKLC